MGYDFRDYWHLPSSPILRFGATGNHVRRMISPVTCNRWYGVSTLIPHVLPCNSFRSPAGLYQFANSNPLHQRK